MKEKIIEFNKGLGIEYTGVTQKDGHTFVVCLFPYYATYKKNSNISIYTYSKDYHKVIKTYLEKISEFIIKNSDAEIFGTYSDISPYNDIDLAYNAGLGIIGKNNLLINEKYGTFVFIGYIETSLDIPLDSPIKKSCLECGNCIKKCPSGALNEKDFSICLSNITQKKAALNEFEENLIKSNKYVFGCDICQLSCPMNKFVKTPIKEFQENLIFNLNKEMFQDLSNKEFNSLYKDRAFSWRGKNVLLRNLDIISSKL